MYLGIMQLLLKLNFVFKIIEIAKLNVIVLGNLAYLPIVSQKQSSVLYWISLYGMAPVLW
jgi:hypothetical protein